MTALSDDSPQEATGSPGPTTRPIAPKPKPKHKVLPRPKEAHKSPAANKTADQNTAKNEHDGGVDGPTMKKPAASTKVASKKRPAAATEEPELKVCKYRYNKTGVWGFKLNGSEKIRVALPSNIKTLRGSHCIYIIFII